MSEIQSKIYSRTTEYHYKLIRKMSLEQIRHMAEHIRYISAINALSAPKETLSEIKELKRILKRHIQEFNYLIQDLDRSVANSVPMATDPDVLYKDLVSQVPDLLAYKKKFKSYKAKR